MHVGMSYGDPNAGLHAAFAVLTALYHREMTGEGQYIDMSQWESTMAVLGEAFVGFSFSREQPARQGSRVPDMAPHGVFPALGDDAWISIACPTDESWAALASAMGQPGLATDERFATLAARKTNEDDLEMEILAWTAALDPFETTRQLQAAGVAAFPAMKNSDLAEDPHLATRNFWVEKEHPEVGIRKHAGIPWRMSATPCEVWRAAPVMGQDNDYVFGEVLGMGKDEIAGLVEREVIR
jgi:crotonobetainyl-CoA:carnitine CoA-transferase CaiB-like acyl-CoA transferase